MPKSRAAWIVLIPVLLVAAAPHPAPDRPCAKGDAGGWLLKSSEFDMLHFALPFEIFGWLASGFQVLSGAVARMSGRGEAINNSVLRG